jgi:hypothetical protein
MEESMGRSCGSARLSRRSILFGMAILPASTLPALAAEPKPTGQISVEQVQVAFIGSANLGGGTLQFQGKPYGFTVGGLGIGGIGISKIEATGTVYDLYKLADFPGAYGQARTGIAVGNLGGGDLWLQNPNGVYIHLEARRKGLALSLGVDGLLINLD